MESIAEFRLGYRLLVEMQKIKFLLGTGFRVTCLTPYLLTLLLGDYFSNGDNNKTTATTTMMIFCVVNFSVQA